MSAILSILALAFLMVALAKTYAPNFGPPYGVVWTMAAVALAILSHGG